jgi:hypothetical protein
VTYDDGRVACTEEALVIRTYYFPPHGKRNGRYRIWGSGDFIHWYNYDPRRPRKSVALIVHVAGHRVRPVITPDNPDGVAAELAAHGVKVAAG